jgi:hypothetical protein
MGREVYRVSKESTDINEDYIPGDWWQMWQTISYRPYTPAFETPEELALWCAEHPWGSEVSYPVSYDTWLKFIKEDGCSATLIINNGVVMSGVESMGIGQ